MTQRAGRWLASAMGLAALAACAQPYAKPYVGTWSRVSENGGAIKLTIKPTGTFEMRLARPPEPVDSLMRGPGVFHGDTVSFSGAKCEPGAARYALERNDSSLTITQVGSDGCALRRATLAGVWKRE
jgi:hypothetical protein